MSVYVDNINSCLRSKKWPYRSACHLVADTVAELHRFAKRLGLKRIWFQNKLMPHYDLTPNKRRQAVKLGATEIEIKEMIKLLRNCIGD